MASFFINYCDLYFRDKNASPWRAPRKFSSSTESGMENI